MPEDKSTPPPDPVKQHTPGPWEARFIAGAGWEIYSPHGMIASMVWWQFDSEKMNNEISGGNARLMAASMDHALLLAAVCAGKARWEAWDDARGEVACAGLRYATTLDPFGCPVLTDRLRAELRKAVGL